jgi:hypothetical protein
VRRLGLSLVLLSAALLLPTGAQAQVVVDPDSPAGKEYAIPLEEKRDQAAGGKDDSQSKPFGEGISKPGSKGGDAKASASRESRGKKEEPDNGDFDTTGATGGSSSGGGGGGSSGGPDEAGTNGALLTSGIALAVLLLGGGIAFLMRRGAFGTDP